MKRLFMVIALILLYAPLVFGLPGVKQWKAVWDANTEADLAGYYFYWRIPFGEFNDANRVDVGLATEWALGDVPFSSILAITAYDTSGNEGDYSDEYPFDKDGIAPGAVGGLRIIEE